MSIFVLTNAKVAYGGRDMSGILNQIALGGEVDLQEDTAMGDTFRTRIPGLKDGNMNMDGYWESTSASDSADADLFAKIGATKELISLSAEGGTVGDVGYSFEADMANYNQGASLGEIYPFNITAQGNGPLLRGTVMENVVRTSTADGTGYELGNLTSAQTLYSAIHVLSVSGTNPTLDVVVQSDELEAMGTPTTRITHAQLTTVGSELLSVAGPITPDDWFRLEMTIGGTNTPTFDIFGVIAIL